MLRLIFIVLTGLFGVPGIIYSIKKVGKDPNSTMEERYAQARRLCAFVIKHGNMEPIVTGIENIPEKSGYLIAPNHQGLIDAILICNSHDKPLTAVGKEELNNYIVVKDILRLVKARVMERSNLRQSMKVIKEVTNDMLQGITYIIFPEGTRSKKGNEMNEFKGGTFKSAMNAKADIVPVCLIDCFKVLDSKGIKKVYPQVHYLKPLTYEDYKGLSSNEIASLVQSKIQDKMNECLGK